MPDPETQIILHVKGTEKDTTRLPKHVVRAAISQGQITHSQLIWSPEDHAWKQVRELPHLLPSQKLAPAPASRAATPPAQAAAAPQVRPQISSGTVPRVAVKASAGKPTAVKASAPVQASAKTASAPQSAGAKPKEARSFVVKEDHGAHPLKWLCFGLGLFIAAATTINYLLVERPLVSHFAQTPYARVMVYGHLGAFVQPNVLVIHIPGSTAITRSNLIDFLVALAHSTPDAPFSGNQFARVALTSGWMAQYSFSGYTWKQLGDMGQEDEAQRKEFILAGIGDAAGQPLAAANPALGERQQQAERDRIWAEFVARFAAKD